MSQKKHQWTKFEKGRFKLTACASCGEMSLPNNVYTLCDQRKLPNSSIVRAGYRESVNDHFF